MWKLFYFPQKKEESLPQSLVVFFSIRLLAKELEREFYYFKQTGNQYLAYEDFFWNSLPSGFYFILL